MRDGSDDGHIKGLEAFGPVPAGTAGRESEKGQADFGWHVTHFAQVCPDRSMGTRQLAKVHH